MTTDGEVTAVDAVGGGLKKKGGGGGRRSWIILDSSGQEIVVDVEKYAIMQRVQIHARDIRILDPLLFYPSAILARGGAILLNLEHIKAIITPEEVLVRDPLDDNVVPVVEELRRRLKQVNEDDDSPFEFRVLEAALEAICSFLSARALELAAAVYPVLDMLTSKISGRNLERVRKLKSQITRLTARVQRVRDELEQLLDDDDDMGNFYLSRMVAAANTVASSPVHGDDNDVEQLEMLLEAYYMQIDATFSNLTRLREYIDSTEDYINIQLDSNRNQLIQLELFLSIGTVCLSLYSLVAAIFGMNIQYTWMDNHGYLFKWVVISGGIFSAVLFVLIMSYARYKRLVGS